MVMQQQQRSEYEPPMVLKNSGPPRAIYLAPIYKYAGKQTLIVGERLTSMENPLSADPRDEARYLRKGFKLATKADIQRLSGCDGKSRLFDDPLESLAEFGVPAVHDPKAGYLENQVKAQQQKIAALEAEIADRVVRKEKDSARRQRARAKAKAAEEA